MIVDNHTKEEKDSTKVEVYVGKGAKTGGKPRKVREKQLSTINVVREKWKRDNQTNGRDKQKDNLSKRGRAIARVTCTSTQEEKKARKIMMENEVYVHAYVHVLRTRWGNINYNQTMFAAVSSPRLRGGKGTIPKWLKKFNKKIDIITCRRKQRNSL